MRHRLPVLTVSLQRQSRSSRPAARPAPAQSRGAHTAAVPMSGQHAPSAARAPAPPAQAQTQTKEPGMLAQMAATAGSVAVGSTIGHGLSSMLFGGGGGQAAPVEQQQPVQQQQQGYQQGMSCDVQAKGMYCVPYKLRVIVIHIVPDFTKCLEKADVQSCSYYLEQLKAVKILFAYLLGHTNLCLLQCQAAAAPY